jgi:hypothetical protein
VPFDLPRTPANRIQFQIADVAGITGTVTYTVRGPLSIDGPAVGTIDTPYTFTAALNPVTGTVVPPITYTWQATEQAPVVHRSGGIDVAIFTWTVPGPKTVAVTATSVGGDIAVAAHGIAARDMAAEGYVYLPMVMRNWTAVPTSASTR